MKYLAIDYGLKRVGIAVSDPSGAMAFPRMTIENKGKTAFFEELLAIIDAEKAEAIVVGLPLYSDGSESETTRIVKNMVERLKRRCPLPVHLVEEELSSHEAEHYLTGANKQQKNKKKVIDQLAAVIILNSFLERSHSLP